MARKDSGGLQALQAEIRALSGSVKQHDKVLLGNGHPGLVQTVAKLEGVVNGLVTAMSKVEDSSRRMEASALRMEVHTTEMSKGMSAFKKNVAAIEDKLEPIINWKKGVYLRVTTIIGTVSIIFGALWWLVEHVDKIKELLK